MNRREKLIRILANCDDIKDLMQNNDVGIMEELQEVERKVCKCSNKVEQLVNELLEEVDKNASHSDVN